MEEKRAKENLHTYPETLWDIALVALERLEMLFRLSLNEGDAERVCHIGEALIRDARNLLNEGNDYIEKEFGSVAIKRICHGQIGSIPEEMVYIDFKPAGKEISRARAGERLNPGG